jgi:hypothetical protein
MIVCREKNNKAILEHLGITIRTGQKTIKRFGDVLEDVDLVRKAGPGRPKKSGEQGEKKCGKEPCHHSKRA